MKRKPSTSQQTSEGQQAALRIARALLQEIVPGTLWHREEPLFEPPRRGHWQYGLVPVMASRAASFDFSVWMDRTKSLVREDRPILCAAFGANPGADASLLEGLARAEDVRPQEYAMDQDDRFVGFDGEPVLDLPSNKARYLSLYRPAGDFDVDRAVKEFKNFWVEWAPRIARLCHVPPQRRVRRDWRVNVLRGLVAELVVLTKPEMKGARWVGASTESHDIELGPRIFEVKSSAGDHVTLSRPQIRAAVSDRVFVAIVRLRDDAQRAILGLGKAAPTLHPVVAKNRAGIRRYLQRGGMKDDTAILAAISAAVRLSENDVSFHRLRPPAGFSKALDELERFGRLSDLAIQCNQDWFVHASLT